VPFSQASSQIEKHKHPQACSSKQALAASSSKLAHESGLSMLAVALCCWLGQSLLPVGLHTSGRMSSKQRPKLAFGPIRSKVLLCLHKRDI